MIGTSLNVFFLDWYSNQKTFREFFGAWPYVDYKLCPLRSSFLIRLVYNFWSLENIKLISDGFRLLKLRPPLFQFYCASFISCEVDWPFLRHLILRVMASSHMARQAWVVPELPIASWKHACHWLGFYVLEQVLIKVLFLTQLFEANWAGIL